jgi:NADPH2:quinone reductase
MPVPSSVSTETTAACLLQGLMALRFAQKAYPIAAGNTVFVHTVAGGLGLFAQYVSSLGAHIIGTTSTAEKAAKAKKAGARDA